MKRSKFKALLKSAIIEKESSDTYELKNPQDEEFYFQFSLEHETVKIQGDIELSERQWEKIYNRITDFCHETKAKDIDIEDELEKGIFGYGY